MCVFTISIVNETVIDANGVGLDWAAPIGSSPIWVHPVLENHIMCQKFHKSLQRTTGQTIFYFC